MPFMVITLKRVPNSLRGDLTRWMQEIATGVYVGNYNARIREYLWKRVTETVGNGEATLSYSCQNEIGYSFCTLNTERQVVDYDGIPLVLLPRDTNESSKEIDLKYGFSDASKYHHARNAQKYGHTSSDLEGKHKEKRASAILSQDSLPLVFIDLETTGLDPENDQIIEIGAVKVGETEESEYHRFVHIDGSLSDKISNLTGITEDMLKRGIGLDQCIRELNAFIQETILVGYNIAFDLKFLNREMIRYHFGLIHNRVIDLMQEVKKKNSFQTDYKFETSLRNSGIEEKVPHRALEDARLMRRLYDHLR